MLPLAQQRAPSPPLIPCTTSGTLDIVCDKAQDHLVSRNTDLLPELQSKSDDPLGVLRIVAKYRSLLDEVSHKAVATARGMGISWEEIAEALGTSRQSAWERFRKSAPTGDTVPMVLRRFPGTRRHLAIRDAITEDYGIVVSDRLARELATKLASRLPRSHETMVLSGRDRSTGNRIKKKVSAVALALYLHPGPPKKRRPRYT